MKKLLLLIVVGIVMFLGLSLYSACDQEQTVKKVEQQEIKQLPQHKFSLASIGKRSQIRAIVKRGSLTESNFKQIAVNLCKKHSARGCYLVSFFSNVSCLDQWDGTGLLRDSVWPYWLCHIPVDTNSAGKLYARGFKLAKDVNTGKDRTDVLFNKVEQQKIKQRTAEVKRLAQIKQLEAEVGPVPASDVYLNFVLYEQLLDLDPDNPKYKKKVAYYKAEIDKREAAVERRARARKATETAEYKKLIQTALSEGVLCKVWMTENYIRIHVTRIFYTWTFTAKIGVCEAAMRAYPGHKGVMIYDCYTNKDVGLYSKYGLKMK